MATRATPDFAAAAERSRLRWLSGLLLVWALWDLTLAVVAGLFPDFWFRVMHGVPPVDPQALLRRTAGIWLAFSLFHFVAWRRHAERPFWLVVVGGMRLGELFADVLYRFSAHDVTTLGGLALLGAAFTNVFFSWFFISHGLRGLYGLRYFGPVQYHALSALSDVLIQGQREVATPREIAVRVDGYLAAFRSPRKILAKIALLGIEFYPLLTFKPPFSRMSYARRKQFITHRFLLDVSQGRIRGTFRRLVKAMIRFGQQLSFIGYYSDPRAGESVGYTPFSLRARHGGVPPVPAPPKVAPLTVERPATLDVPRVLKADVVVIGSGAAGSVIAHDLVARGRTVLILERGLDVPRTEFVEDEVQSIGRLYDEGALQLATDFQLQILQGSCVGGTTVVNNAVSFRPPPKVIAAWNDTWRSGIDVHRLDQAVASIWQDLEIRNQGATGSILNRADARFKAGAQQLGLPAPTPVDANIGQCVGCGYCNIGCRYGTKLDMRETMLPRAQQNPRNPGALRIFSECRVERIRRQGDRVTGVDCRLSDGRRFRVEAETVVLSAGAISSPFLLLRSGFSHPSLGRHIGFNIGSPITALLPEKVEAFDALQISHYLDDPKRDYVIETWFNPPVAQAMGMPGWFDQHFQNMKDYARMTAAAPLVGTTGQGRITVNLFGDPAIEFEPSDRDLARIKDGLKIIAKIFLAGGAVRVMPATFDYRELKPGDDVDGLIESWIKERGDVTMGTGHPQGGCAVSDDAERGVVDPSFLVRGTTNLYCCDASVFPTPIGVNPQVTVMSLARYAAAHIRQ
jgi:choline dehydrogenase-like flavoprotein